MSHDIGADAGRGRDADNLLPPAGWHWDPDRWGGLRYWDGSQWTPYRAMTTSGAAGAAPRNLWSASFSWLLAGWLATSVATIGAALALAARHSEQQSWGAAVRPVLVLAGVAVAVGAVSGWRRRWFEALVLAVSSGAVITSVFLVSAAVDTEPGADDAAAVGMVTLGAPAILALTALVFTGAALGLGLRQIATIMRKSGGGRRRQPRQLHDREPAARA